MNIKYKQYPFDSKFKLFDSYTGKMLFLCSCNSITEVKRQARLYDRKRDGNCFLELLRQSKNKYKQPIWSKYDCWNY